MWFEAESGGLRFQLRLENGEVSGTGWLLGPIGDDWHIAPRPVAEFLADPPGGAPDELLAAIAEAAGLPFTSPRA